MAIDGHLWVTGVLGCRLRLPISGYPEPATERMMHPAEIQRLRDMYVDKVPCATPRMRSEGWLRREGREGRMRCRLPRCYFQTQVNAGKYWMVDDGGAGRLKQ